LKVPINGSLFNIKEVAEPIRRGDRMFPVSVQYATREILLLRSVPEEAKKFVLAAAVSEACLRHRIPIVWPKWAKND
jgi:hypothetical protein